MLHRSHDAAKIEARDTALHHGRHVGPHLLEVAEAMDDAEQDEIMRAAIFHQHRHVHVLALGLALTGLLAMIYHQPAGKRDIGLEVALMGVALLLIGHTRLRCWVDLRAAHRAGLATWLAAVSVALICGTSVQVLGSTGVATRPLVHWADGVALVATSFLMGLLHMSMVPRLSHTLLFVGVVSLTSAITILAVWSDAKLCTSPSSSVPVVVWASSILGLLAGQPWAISQRLLFVLSKQYTSLQAGKERLAFDYDKQHRQNVRLRREIRRLTTRERRDGKATAGPALLLPPASDQSIATASHSPNSPHTVPDYLTDISLATSDDATPFFSEAIQSAAERVANRMEKARDDKSLPLGQQLQWLGGLQQGPHRISNYARRIYMQKLHVLRQGRRDPSNIWSLFNSDDILSHVLFWAMGFRLEHTGFAGVQTSGTTVGSGTAAAEAVDAARRRDTGCGRGHGHGRGRGRGRGRGGIVGLALGRGRGRGAGGDATALPLFLQAWQ